MYHVYSTWTNRKNETHKEFETKQACYEHIERNAQKETLLSARIQDDDYKVNELWVSMLDGTGRVSLDGAQPRKTALESCEEAKTVVFVYCVLESIIQRCRIFGIQTHSNAGKLKSRTELEIKLIKAMVREESGVIIQDIWHC